LGIRQLLEMLLGPDMRRKMELRQKGNTELFHLYSGELGFRLRSARGLHEAERVLAHFHNYLGEFPPTGQLAKNFLGQFSQRKATTRARYCSVIGGFMAWYGEPLGIKIRIPRTLPVYVENTDLNKLVDSMRAQNKKSHKATASRDVLLVDVMVHTGLRRAEVAALKVQDIDFERRLLLVKRGKGMKDRAIPLGANLVQRLTEYTQGKAKEDSLFGLTAASISGKIKHYSDKAGIKVHAHSLRHAFAQNLMEKGVDIRAVQQLLGHEGLATTQSYVTTTDQRLREAVDRLEEEPQPAPTPAKAPATFKMAWETVPAKTKPPEKSFDLSQSYQIDPSHPIWRSEDG
jgi:integrase/recombinase XerD